MPATANLPTLALVVLDPSVWLFALDGIGASDVLWMNRCLGVLTVIGILSIPTTLYVIHDNWQCYADDSMQAVIYGRCTKITALIHQHPELQRTSGTRPLSTAEWTGIGLIIVVALLFVLTVIAHVVAILVDIHYLSLPPQEDYKKTDNSQAGRALAAAYASPRRWFTNRKVTLLYAAKRFKRIIQWGPVSIVLCFPAIIIHESGLYVLAQITLCGATAGLVYAAVTAATGHVLVWQIAAGCTAFLAALNHGILAVRFGHWLDESIKEANEAVRHMLPSSDSHADIMSTITLASYRP
jgi:hypothetical protein